MAVASGTSTPTSTTVVETSTGAAPDAKRASALSFSSAGSRPCRTPTSTPASSGSARSSSTTSRTARGGRRGAAPASPRVAGSSATRSAPSASSAVILGHTTYALPPESISSRTRLHVRASHAGRSAGTTNDVIGDRPAGSSRSTDVSRSPKTVIATVRGMGVAVIASRWGCATAFALSASRCSTPNRCCSSTTTSPSSANCTVFSSRACVPTTMPAAPEAASSSA